MVGVESALAVDAVESADFSVGGHQVNAERNAEAAAVDGTEDGRGEDDALMTLVFRITVWHGVGMNCC